MSTICLLNVNRTYISLFQDRDLYKTLFALCQYLNITNHKLINSQNAFVVK